MPNEKAFNQARDDYKAGKGNCNPYNINEDQDNHIAYNIMYKHMVKKYG